MKRIVVSSEKEVPSLKRVGMIGGMGHQATVDILFRIHRVAAARIPQYANRGQPPIDLRAINQAPMWLNEDGSLPIVIVPTRAFLDAARYVAKDSDFIVMASNTPHLFAAEVERAAGRPLLSIVDLAMEEVISREVRRVGVLAAGVTLQRRLYQDSLEALGVEAVTISANLSEKLDNEAIYPVQEGADPYEVGAAANNALIYLRDQGVDAIILGCTELPLLLGHQADDPDVINPSQLLAEAIVEVSLGNRPI